MNRLIKQNVFTNILITLSMALSLQSCVFVAGAAIGAAAITVVYDHRTIENVLNDAEISNKVADRIKTDQHLRNDSHIEVTVFNHTVLLTGETPNPDWREQAGLLAKSVPAVTKLYNQITIEGPTSSLTRTSDSWITTKTKSQMLATEDLKSGSIKGMTENGVVYLMGMVSRQPADIAVDIARKVHGVQKVIKVFQYTD